MTRTVVHLCYDIARGTGETLVFDDFPAAGAGDREGNTMSETAEDYDAAAGTDAQDDNAAAEAQAGAATDEDTE